MDGRTFDAWLQSLTDSRRSVLRGALGLMAGIAGVSTIKAKKKKRKCAKKCADGCCTGKRGKCIQPAQQNATQCGTGGEICRTNCSVPPPPASCGAECSGCCAGTTCFELGNHDESHCGAGGVACFACDSNQTCLSAKCCGKSGHSCAGAGECCPGTLCNNATCCVVNSSVCTKTSDCCQLVESICENGQCVFATGQPCTAGTMCQGQLQCPASGICDEEDGCTQEQDDACVAQFPNGGCTTACGEPCCVGHLECASSCPAAQGCADAACTPI